MTTETTTRTGHHPCPADSCGESIPRHLFACSRHWYALTPALRREVRSAWHGVRVDPLHYLEVRQEAIDFLNGTQ